MLTFKALLKLSRFAYCTFIADLIQPDSEGASGDKKFCLTEMFDSSSVLTIYPGKLTVRPPIVT